ncbi:hypothetical protein BJ684DRAFT_15271 [Piptocephalis cylindrospora]|uniref:RING-type domain-containing protein n=1 Tax=Piptocephalis cylindrospora TaxID=1907219 RepID=A0A4P9Y5X2_9FUNG|nr:hypothetical protein BJ684DRAFT_15271 [Piptocephalis cylindrospora]|eukprot:RKP14397.1 hypothetical protein BJ684DRAFT_15271 [Piptocephalis cylindrospora]
MPYAQPEYDYITEPPEDLQCPICTDAYIAPVQVTRCGHLFCRECLHHALSRTCTCPFCRAPLLPAEDVVEARELAQRTDALIGPRRGIAHHYADVCMIVALKCGDDPRFSGCPEELARSALEAHRPHCSYYRDICTWACGYSAPHTNGNALALHERSMCSERPVTCGACGTSTTSLRPLGPPVPGRLAHRRGRSGQVIQTTAPSISPPLSQPLSPPMDQLSPLILPTSITGTISPPRLDGPSRSSSPSPLPVNHGERTEGQAGVGRMLEEGESRVGITEISPIPPSSVNKTPPQSPPPSSARLPSNQLRARDLPMHHQRECPAAIVSCPHRHILGNRGGCMETMARKDLTRHCLDECPWHRTRAPIQALTREITLLEQRLHQTERTWRSRFDAMSTLVINASFFPPNPKEAEAAITSRVAMTPPCRRICVRGFGPDGTFPILCSTFLPSIVSPGTAIGSSSFIPSRPIRPRPQGPPLLAGLFTHMATGPIGGMSGSSASASLVASSSHDSTRGRSHIRSPPPPPLPTASAPPRSPLLLSSPAQSLPSSSINPLNSSESPRSNGLGGGLNIGVDREASPGRGTTASDSDEDIPLGETTRLGGERRRFAGTPINGDMSTGRESNNVTSPEIRSHRRNSSQEGPGDTVNNDDDGYDDEEGDDEEVYAGEDNEEDGGRWGSDEPEEISLEELDFRGSSILWSGALPLARAISRPGSLRILRLGGNGLSAHGAEAVVKALRYHPHLHTLDLSSYLGRNDLRHPGIKAIAEWVVSSPGIETLILSENEVSGAGLGYLGQALLHASSLRVLRLQRCRVGGPRWPMFLSALFHSSCMIEELDLTGCSLSDSEGAELATHISTGSSPPSCIRLAQHSMPPDVVQFIRRSQALGGNRIRLPGLGGGRRGAHRHSPRSSGASGPGTQGNISHPTYIPSGSVDLTSEEARRGPRPGLSGVLRGFDVKSKMEGCMPMIVNHFHGTVLRLFLGVDSQLADMKRKKRHFLLP